MRIAAQGRSYAVVFRSGGSRKHIIDPAPEEKIAVLYFVAF